MSIWEPPGASFEATVSNFATGLTGTARVRILDNVGATTFGPATAGIAEYPAGSGFYTVTLTAPTTAGQYTVLWDTGTLGPSTTAAEDLIVSYSAAAAGSPSGVDLCTVADVRTVLETPSTDTTRDTLTQDLITSASRMIQSYSEREFVATTVATRRFLVWPGQTIIDLAPFDCRTPTAVTLHPESSSPQTLTEYTDYVRRPVQPRFSVYTHLSLSYRLVFSASQVSRYFGFAFIDITGSWGFATVPGEARDACRDTVVAWLRRDMSAVSFNGMQSLDSSQAGERPTSAFTLPYSCRMKLDPFRRSLPGL